ncbi:MAG: ribosomal protein L7/L12 [Planctomycetota bacterium]|nr:ribosomal protein L7/L12 [Planctomycetota bacterium]MDA1142210.1 ribosomal protein L7/L12 [Planctomycetota bacterium]
MPNFRVILLNAGETPNRVINRLRDVTGFSLVKAEWFLQNLPLPIVDGIEGKEQADKIRMAMAQAGAGVRLEPTGSKSTMMVWKAEFDNLDTVASQFPPRPHSFSWVLKNQLGGMGRPYVASDLEFLKSIGLDLLVSLTEMTLPEECIKFVGCNNLHIPVQDLTPPSVDQIRQTVQTIESTVQAGGKAVVHCGAGMGRTGVMLAAYLVFKGFSAAEAINSIREQRPGSIETRDQEQIIIEFAAQAQ